MLLLLVASAAAAGAVLELVDEEAADESAAVSAMVQPLIDASSTTDRCVEIDGPMDRAVKRRRETREKVDVFRASRGTRMN